MLNHYFKLVWARRRTHIFVLVTLSLSFIAMSFFSSRWIIEIFPIISERGFNYQEVFQFEIAPKDSLSLDEATNSLEQVKTHIQTLPSVTSVGLTYNVVPFIRFERGWTRYGYEGKIWEGITYRTDKDYANVMEISMMEGNWIGNETAQTAHPPVVVNEVVARQFLGEGSPIGKTIRDEGSLEKFTIVGMVKSYNHFEDSEWEDPAIFKLVHNSNSGAVTLPNQLLIKYKKGVNEPELREELEKAIHKVAIPGGWDLGQKETLKTTFDRRMKSLRTTASVIGIIFFILMGNIAIGLLGSIWYQVILRTGEIGVRRSMGSTQRGIREMVVGEALAIVSIGILIGGMFFIQVPIFQFLGLEFFECLIGMGFSALFLYLFALTCAWYPAREAAKVHPAMALHEE